MHPCRQAFKGTPLLIMDGRMPLYCLVQALGQPVLRRRLATICFRCVNCHNRHHAHAHAYRTIHVHGVMHMQPRRATPKRTSSPHLQSTDFVLGCLRLIFSNGNDGAAAIASPQSPLFVLLHPAHSAERAFQAECGAADPIAPPSDPSSHEPWQGAWRHAVAMLPL